MRHIRAVVLIPILIIVSAWALPLLAQVESDAPTGLVATTFNPVSDKSVLLTWQDNSDTDIGFIVQASPTGNSSWTTIAYTPEDHIRIHSDANKGSLGVYPLQTGTSLWFRVYAKKLTGGPPPGQGLGFYSNKVHATVGSVGTCATEKLLSPVPDFLAHGGIPIDLWIDKNFPLSCAANYNYCVIQGPPGMDIDFHVGLLFWTPPAPGATPSSNPVSIGFVPSGMPCTAENSIATTSFTITVDDNTVTQPLQRDYRSEEAEVAVTGRAYQSVASWALYSTEFNGTYSPIVEEAPPNSTPVGPATNDLAVWNIEKFKDGSRRLLSLIMQSPSKQNVAIYNPVIIDRTSFNSNWPKRLPAGSVAGALAVDLTNDGKDEIIANSRSSSAGGPYVWGSNGELIWQAPGAGIVTQSEVAVGDVNGDGNNDVVTVSDSKVRVFGSAGTLLASIQIAGSSPTNKFSSGASLADIDGDRHLEILVNRMDGAVAKTEIYKLVSGTLVSYSADWPKTMATQWAMLRPSTADLDGDGHLDVIVDNHEFVYAWSTDPGHPLPGWPDSRVAIPPALYPIHTQVTGGTDPHAFAQPAIADLNADGTLEIVVGQNVISSNGTYLYGLNDGVGITAAVGMSAAIGEFDHALAGPEILLGAYVFPSNPILTFRGSPVRVLGPSGDSVGLSTIVDGGRDDNGQPQTYVLAGSMNATAFTANVSAFESDGSIDDEYPKSLYGNTNGGSAPQAGDFDGDGYEDVLVEITDGTYGAVVALYKTSVKFNAANNPWPMAGHDPQRTGRYSCKQQRQACTGDSQCCSARCNTGVCQ